MEKKFFVRSSEYTATDWHDMASVETQMKENEDYQIKDAEGFIAKSIYDQIKELVDGSVTVEFIKERMNGEDDVYIDVVVPERVEDERGVVNCSPSRIELFSKNHSGYGFKYHYDYVDYTYLVQFLIDEIEEENIAYLVSEHIVNPGKGCDLLERCYHELFDTLEEAEKYRSEMEQSCEAHYCSGSGFKITVVDRQKELEKNSWYQVNLRAARKLTELNKDWKEYRYYRSAGVVIEELQKEIYENASAKKRHEIDREIYESIRKFLTTKDTEELDVILSDDCTESRKLVDIALVRSFVNATSQDVYDAIKEALGDWRCRIIELNLQILRKHPGKGYVLVSKSGEIRWYKHGFYLGEHGNRESNPYYRKFLHCFGFSELDCFSRFAEHDCFVDEFPSEEYVDSFEPKNKGPFD